MLAKAIPADLQGPMLFSSAPLHPPTPARPPEPRHMSMLRLPARPALETMPDTLLLRGP